MKLTADQDAILEELAATYSRYREHKATARARALQKADEEVLAYRLEVDKIAARAAHAGIPTRQIAHAGMLTTDQRTARDAVARGMELWEPEVAPESEETTANDAGAIRLVDGAVEVQHEGSSWMFTHSPESGVQPLGVDDLDTWANPVVLHVLAPKQTAIREQIKNLVTENKES